MLLSFLPLDFLKYGSECFFKQIQDAKVKIQYQDLILRVSEKNKCTRLRRILVRVQGASASAYLWICAGGCNAVDGPKDKPEGEFIFYRGPNDLFALVTIRIGYVQGTNGCL